jgi:hypothetical protein
MKGTHLAEFEELVLLTIAGLPEGLQCSDLRQTFKACRPQCEAWRSACGAQPP